MKNLFVGFLLFIFVLTLNAQPVQWRGPARDGHFPETGLLKSWPADGPELILEAEGIGKGFSSPVMVENIIYTTGMKDTLDYLSAIDMEGNIKWQIPYGRSWDTKGSVVMADGMLYAYNERGKVGLIKPGDESFDVISEFTVTKGAGPHWAHPFISQGKLLLRHGDVLMVFDIKEK
jgi:outer membrane protein assembly factor BamB